MEGTGYKAPCGCYVEDTNDVCTCEHCGNEMCVHCFAAGGHVDGRLCNRWIKVDDALPMSGEHILVVQEWDAGIGFNKSKGHTVYLAIYSAPGTYKDDLGRFAPEPGWYHEFMGKFIDGIVAWCRYPGLPEFGR